MQEIVSKSKRLKGSDVSKQVPFHVSTVRTSGPEKTTCIDPPGIAIGPRLTKWKVETMEARIEGQFQLNSGLAGSP
jgi:hypothetical protein